MNNLEIRSPSSSKKQKSRARGTSDSSREKINKRFNSPPKSDVAAWKKVKRDEQHFQESLETLPLILSKDDLNKLAAKYLKADMLGEKALASRLKEQLEQAKQAFEESERLTKVDRCGVLRHQSSRGEDAGFERRSGHKAKESADEMASITRKAIEQQHQQCEFCLDQPNMKHHLLVAVREQVYVSVPNYESLTKGHCFIVPKSHVPSLLHLDKDEWDEIEEVKSLLRSMFRTHHQSVLFLETSMNFRWCPRALLECVPVPEEEGDMAPCYFKKAILECEEEWAHNVKLVDLSKKGLRRSVPKNLPYFYVLFDPAVHAGYAHVIENERRFSRNFGKEVIGGMLDIPYRNKKSDPVKKSNEVLNLKQMLKACEPK